jgi:hypothetical protein
VTALIDLQLQQPQCGGPITAFVVSPSGQESAVLSAPAEALEWQAEWRRQFLACHDPAAAAVRVDAVRDFGENLSRALRQWFEQSACGPLRQALLEYPQLPVRLRLEGEGAAALERLPWEQLLPERSVWRLQPSRPGAAGTRVVQRARLPRLLLLVGDEGGLSLEEEVQRLEALQSRKRLELRVLRGERCTLSALRSALLERRGWDVLVFLGHSEADPHGGGRLHLGDGSWVSGAAFGRELQQAAQQGLALALFNSCSGLDLARSSVEAGIAWALCFREPVPCAAASLAFCGLLSALEQGKPLLDAVRRARGVLVEQDAAAGADLLLSLVGGPQAGEYRLPLRKRRQFLLRLRRSTWKQAMASAVLVALGVIADVNPANPISAYLLDRRLYVQRLWRGVTDQPGPDGDALPVLVLTQRSAAQMGAEATPGRVPRDLLARVLAATPVDQVPVVGLDVVLDEAAPFTEQLAAVLAQQRRELVFAGYFGEEVEARGEGLGSLPLPVLQQAGLQARDLATGTPWIAGALKWVPLQLWSPISRANFAGTLSLVEGAWMPADAVIDWSIDWRPLLRRVELAELPQLRAAALVVGTDGSLDRYGEDLFAAPGAMDPALTQIWQGARRKLPGVLVQAVLSQSLTLRHWLMPVSAAGATALAAGLGVVVAAAQAQRRRRVLLLAAIAVMVVPLSWQLAVSALCLVPLLLPLSALAVVALLRRT